jgi:WD40 repeat protein
MNSPGDEESSNLYRYWAFISYSHADEKWARWLHRGIETYQGHSKLVGSMNRNGEAIPKRLSPVFRDRDELGAATDLPKTLEDALAASKFLIVICSPAAAGSKWVNEEIRRFEALGRSNQVLAVVVDGEPWASRSGSPANECFPEALRYKLESPGEEAREFAEPLAADARATGDGTRNALVKIVSAILGVRFDELRRRDDERRRRNLLIAASTLSVIALTVLSLLAYSVVQRWKAAAQARVAKSQRLVSVGTSELQQSRMDNAILLAAAAFQVAPTFEARHLLGKLMGTEPALRRYLASSGPVVTAIDVDASGNYAATSHEKSVTIWDLARGSPGPSMKGNDEKIAYVCFVGGRSDHVAAVTEPDTLIIWQQGKQTSATKLSDTALNKVQCASGTPQMIGVDVDGGILEWDLTRPGDPAAKIGRIPAKRIMTFNRDGSLLAAVDNESMDIYDRNTRSVRHTDFQDKRLRLSSAHLSRDGKQLAAVDLDVTLRLFSTESGHQAPLSLQLPGLVLSFCFSPDSKSLALTLNNGSAILVDREIMGFRRRMLAAGGSNDSVVAVGFSPDGNTLVSGSQNGKVVQWDVEPSTQHRAETYHKPCTNGNARHVSMGANSWLGSVCDDGAIIAMPLSDPGSRRAVQLEERRVREVEAFHLGADGKSGLLLGGSEAGLVSFASGLIDWKSPDDEKDHFALLARDSQAAEVAALSTGGQITVWDLTRNSSRKFRDNSKRQRWSGMAFDAKHGRVAAISDRDVFLGTMSGGHLEMRQLPGETEGDGALTFGSDGLDLFGVGFKGKILQWRLAQPEAKPVEAVLGGFARFVGSSPAERLLLVVSNRKIWLVEPVSGKVLFELEGSEVRQFSFSPDGSKLVVHSGGYLVPVIDLDVSHWLRDLCLVANRNFSPAEWQQYIGADVTYERTCPNVPADRNR